ncbi:replication protein A 70 kDa DNA-binding subunit C [Trifolium repens]|nr:replication protein A 70 kDa DNA-binding subunit C [Trifolium repens]
MAKVCKRFDSIAEILPDKETVRIQVRVLKLWKVPAFLNPAETSSIEMVLVDEKGGKIHASIRKQLFLAEVCSHSHDYEFLVDVIGLMTGISPEREYVRDGKITKMVVIELTDASGKCDCALFGDYVGELNKKMGKAGEGLPVVVIQFAKVKIFRDQTSIQNVINTTRIFVNPDIPEAHQFKDSIVVHGIELDSNVPVIGRGAKPSMDEEFLRMHSRKTITELKDLEEDGVFTVYGVVSGIVQEQEWWYPACKCHKSVVPDSGAYFCNGCGKHVFQIVEVSDGGSTCVFVIFDSDMSYILERSCAHFVGKSKVASDGSFPIEFQALVGKKMLFVIDKGLKHAKIVDGTFRVKRVCFNSKIIETFCAEGSFFTPVKPASPLIDIESDGDNNDVDNVVDSQPLGFMKDIIVSPPRKVKSPLNEDVVLNTVKRNLVEAFDGVSKSESRKSLRRVKIEKE